MLENMRRLEFSTKQLNVHRLNFLERQNWRLNKGTFILSLIECQTVFIFTVLDSESKSLEKWFLNSTAASLRSSFVDEASNLLVNESLESKLESIS